MKVMVTGATGFLGKAAALRLHALGHEVTALGRNRAIGEALQGPKFLAVDLEDATAVANACRDQDVVIHSGALSSVWGPYAAFHAANVLGTRHVIEGCLAHGVGRLLNISSPTIYFDYREKHGVKETDALPTQGVNAYAVTKRLAEVELERAAPGGLRYVNFRPRGIFGPGDTAILPRIIRANAEGMVPLIGREDPLLDLTYVENVVDALIAAMDAPGVEGKTYNLSNGAPVRLWATLASLFEQLGQPMRGRRMSYHGAMAAATLMELAGRLRGKEPVLTRYTVGVLSRGMTLDISAARQDLGYEPRVGMEDGMAHFVAWWKQQ
ncbi:MAG: NAD-dependent epimerase/dehydratase family protein [Cyanobacteria bacterium RYN_339]|nr:NAD-dependent epimerase/dehydratase family protein [Cyanobacteria bacterium RYN_339]